MNTLGELLKELRGLNSLRAISEKTNNRISYTYLGTLEKGINPNNGQPVKPTPETLKILSDVYDYPYERFLRLAGYLDDSNEDKVKMLYKEYQKLSKEEQDKFIALLNIC